MLRIKKLIKWAVKNKKLIKSLILNSNEMMLRDLNAGNRYLLIFSGPLKLNKSHIKIKVSHSFDSNFKNSK